MTTSHASTPLKIAYLTAGAAGMFCGSCMRDNTLAAALTKLGVDIQLIPTYTPIRTDEESVAIDKVFFGGINVYLQSKSSFFRLLPRWLDRVLDRPWLINWLASRGMETSARELGELTVTMLKGEHGNVRKEVFRLVDWLKREAKPDLVNLSNILIGGCIPTIKRELGVPVVVTLQGDDLFLLDLEEPYKSQAIAEIRRIAKDVDAFIVFSKYYADFMGELLGLDPNKIHVVPMGIRIEDFSVAPRRPAGRPLRVGYFARICPAKGFHHVIDAFAKLRTMPGTEQTELHAAGWLGEGDKRFFDEQIRKIERLGLKNAFQYRGVVDRDEKIRFMHDIDVLSVPTTYHEPKGLFVLEALASGVPVVQPDHGAFPELLAQTGGGKLHRANDPQHLAETLHHLLINHHHRHDLGLAGRSNIEEQFNDQVMATRTLEVWTHVLKAREPDRRKPSMTT